VERAVRAKEAETHRARANMTHFLPVLPVVLLALVCTIGCFWSMRKIDAFLDESDSKHTSQPQATADSNIRLPH